MPDGLSTRALNRALLARQGLLGERIALPLRDAVEAVGPVQAQQWTALPAALGARVEPFAAEDLHAALAAGDLVLGTLLRTTLHLVSAREHPAYAAAVTAAGLGDWRRTDAEPGPEVADLRAALVARAAEAPLSGEDLAAAIEAWLAGHPAAIAPAEVEHQRAHSWRAFQRWSGFVRVPADGRWGAKAPAALAAAPGAGAAPDPDRALEEVVVRHLRAFGPAGADDVAAFVGCRTPPVREAIARLADDLVELRDEDGRVLHDVPDGPRPDPGTPAAPRLLAAFDSVLLAYAGGRRARILPDEHRDAVYERRNLRIRPTFLVDGLVAGTWSSEVKRRVATLTLAPLRPLARGTRTPLAEEAERIVRILHPGARDHAVAIAGVTRPPP
jgi:winged helix DNA-binding protein